MKRTGLVLVALLSFVLVSHRAEAIRLEGFGVRGGLAAGFNDFQFEGVSALDGDAAVGTTFGGFVHVRWSRRSAVGFVIAADFVQKGYEGKRTLAVDGAGREISVSANYLSIPVLGRFTFYDDETVVYAIVGPSVELKLDADEDLLLDGIADWSLAANIGLGAEFPVTRRLAVQLEARYNTDFTDNWDGDASLNVNSARNQLFLLTAGLRF